MRISFRNCNKTRAGGERRTTDCHKRPEMPREHATVARSRGELRAGRLLQSEGWKTKLLLCFCEAFQAGNLEAGRQAQDLSEWEPSIVTHFAQPHVPYPWASTQQDDGKERRRRRWGAGAASLSTSLRGSGLRVCPYVCMRTAGRLPVCPYLLGAGWRASQAILRPAGKREKEVELTLPRLPPWVCKKRVCVIKGWHGWRMERRGRGGSRSCFQHELSLPVTLRRRWHQSASQANLLPAPGPRALRKSGTGYMCVYMEAVHVWALFWCPYACVYIRMRKEKKKDFSTLETWEVICCFGWFTQNRLFFFKAKTLNMHAHTRTLRWQWHSLAPVMFKIIVNDKLKVDLFVKLNCSPKVWNRYFSQPFLSFNNTNWCCILYRWKAWVVIFTRYNL